MPSDPRFLLTGSTGLLGGYLAEKLVARGSRVVAAARPRSDTALLERLGVTVQRGDLTDADFVDRCVAEADVVLHCAAKTTNWGPWSDFERGNILPARNLAVACTRHNIARFVYVSSIAVYGHPPGKELLTEDQPLGQHLWSFDYYNRSKIVAEGIIGELGSRATVVRPTWFIGPRDRVLVPRVLEKLRKGAVWVIGSGENRLNGLAVMDVADGVLAAADAERAQGEAFNLCSSGEISQQEFLDIICAAAELPRVTRHIPYRVAKNFAYVVESLARLRRRRTPPALTRHALSVFTRPVRFSNEKAERLLGWKPQVPLGDALRETLAQIT